MKKLALLGFVLLVLGLARAQETNWVVSSSGSHSDNGTYHLSWTLGETIVHTASSGASASTLTQGFHQPLFGCLEAVSSILVADAGSDTVVCEEQALLKGNILPGSIGVWSTSGTALIDDITSTMPLVFGLESGNNVFTWTLSWRNCIDTNTVNVFYLDAAPVANDDELMLIYEGGASHDWNVLDNDGYVSDNPNISWTVEAKNTGQLFGDLDFNSDGTFTYHLTSRTSVDSFTYCLVYDQCPELRYSDSAKVVIRIDSVLIATSEQADAFSPDGDGMNDFFIIPDLEDGELNEVTIFNRWGQLVFERAGYDNVNVVWNGNYKNTKNPLPAGTYYYVIRQDIGKGKLRYGQVVLVR